MLKLTNISFDYNGSEILKNLSLTIPEHTYLCIAGANGSGKSTLAKVLAGLLKPVQGQIFVKDTMIGHHNIQLLRNYTGYVFANPNQQFLGENVAHDIAFGLETHQVPRKQMFDRIQRVAQACHVDHLLDRTADELSGGEKQRVAIASVLVLEPTVLIFDEATAMLDPENKKLVRQLMRELYDQGHTIIEITHDLNDLLDADQVLWLDNGEIIFQDAPDQLVNLPEKYQVPFILAFSRLCVNAGFLSQPTTHLTELLERFDLSPKK